jgi:NDP-sugar pyrophosphorylase family protein
MGKKQIVTAIVLTQVLYTQQLGPTVDQQKPFFSPVVKSLVLPGWGEYSLDNQIRGRIFVLSETVLLLAILGSYSVAQRQEKEYKAYAAEHAGIDLIGKDRQFWVDIGNYSSLFTFNEEHLRWRDFNALYEDNDTWAWAWDSSNNRERFENTRIASDSWRLRGSFLIGGVVLNHIVSAIDALYLSKISNIQETVVSPNYNPHSDKMELSLTVYF